MLWSGLLSRVGASHRVHLVVPFPLGQNCPRKITRKLRNYETMKATAQNVPSVLIIRTKSLFRVERKVFLNTCKAKLW